VVRHLRTRGTMTLRPASCALGRATGDVAERSVPESRLRARTRARLRRRPPSRTSSCHGGVSVLHGGSLDVDVFLVLSGLLITSLLVAARRCSSLTAVTRGRTCARPGCTVVPP